MSLDPRIDHIIQRDIVAHLVTCEHARYSELKPKSIESNLFMYHLRRLIAQNMVAKTDEGYTLTRQGRHYVDRASLSSLKIRMQPKIITVLTVKRSDGKWLLLKRLHQPFLNYIGFPSGKVHYGETIDEAALRELKEKADINNVKLHLRGNLFMRFMAKEDSNLVVNHVCAYVFSGSVDETVTVTKESENFVTLWGEEQQIYQTPSFKGHEEILELLKQGELFIKNLDFESDF